MVKPFARHREEVWRTLIEPCDFLPEWFLLRRTQRGSLVAGRQLLQLSRRAVGKYEMSNEDVKVPAGTYKDALVVRAEMLEKAGDKTVATKSTMWFAKNVGMVKQSIVIDETRIVLELEKMEVPKK